MTDLTALYSNAGEVLSLVLILISFFSMMYLAYRAKTMKSFQFQMFIVLLVITIAEVPHMLDSIGVISLFSVETFGLTVHAASMVILVVFISLRVARFFNQGRAAK